MKIKFARLPVVLLAALSSTLVSAALPYSWNQPHAKVLPNGDLVWAPTPFSLHKGDSVRYINFENGADDRAGTSPETAWKHHPWDANASDIAQACKGVHTYIFKRGVVYRGALKADESGQPGNPIRLTSDPDWGSGEACIYGSERVTGWQKGGHPAMPEADKVWHADLPFATRMVCITARDSSIIRLKLARTPNWEVSDPDDMLAECWHWENPEWWKDDAKTYKVTVGNTRCHLGVDMKNLTQPAEYYEGAAVWSEWGIVMGAPYYTPVEKFYPEKKAIAFQGPWHGDSQSLHTNNRYWLEDHPAYLDQPGEYWFELKKNGGRLYVRPPNDVAPTAVTIEAARHCTLLDSKAMSHIDISGLSFRFGNLLWNLGARDFQGDVDTAAIRLVGSGTDLHIHHCKFGYLAKAIRIKARGSHAHIDRVTISDNEIDVTDHGAIDVADGTGYAQKLRPAILGQVRILRNKLREIGYRPIRPNGHMALEVRFPTTAEIAGNFIERCGGAGLFLFGGKHNGALYDVPFSRFTVHHNKVVDALLLANDWGAIETWQGGPFYVYNNVVVNPIGPMRWSGKRWSGAYYLDGSFKNFHFNNIARGKNNDVKNAFQASACAFQEIHGYQCSFFNNTAWKFRYGANRQAPVAGRNKYMGNLFSDISEVVFRHSDKHGETPNARDVGDEGDRFAYELNAYSRNVFDTITGIFGPFEATGRNYETLESFREAMQQVKAMAADIGVTAAKPCLRAPADHDFRLTERSAAVDKGVKVFVPWSLYATVGEYPFTPNQADPSLILDEHWYLKDFMVKRDNYHHAQTYELQGHNISLSNFTQGPLENWTHGALKLNGKDQYLVLPNIKPATPINFEIRETYPANWLIVSAPVAAIPGRLLEFTIRLRNPPNGEQLSVDLTWMKAAAFGGWIAHAGHHTIDGTGPYAFKVKPVKKKDLKDYLLTIYISPDGNWKNKSAHTVVRVKPEKAPMHFDPRIAKHNALMECYFKTEPRARGVLVRKMGDVGHALTITDNGTAQIQAGRKDAMRGLKTTMPVNDGKWHHLVAEIDREKQIMNLYLDGRLDASGSGPGPDMSLANQSALYVGGTPEGACLAVTLEFLRFAHGTLADAHTTIEELYAWQFNGPQDRDFTGRKPSDDRRDAGAMEYE